MEVRLNDDKSLDEVVADNASVHLEQMGKDHWWMAIQVEGQRIDIWLTSKRKIRANFEEWNGP